MDATTLYNLLVQNSNNRELISDLIKAHHSLLDNKILNSNTMLYNAASFSYITLVDELIKAGADLNKSSTNNTPLIMAVFFNRPEIAELLINGGCDIEARDEEDKYAFDYLDNITDSTKREKIRLMLKSVADGKKPKTAFTVDTLAALLSKDKSNEILISTLIKTYKLLLNDILESGNTLLTQFARDKNGLTVIRKLIANNADVNKKDKFEQTALWVAVELQNIETAKLLLDAGATKDVRVDGMSIYKLISDIAEPFVKEKFCSLFEFNITEKPVTPVKQVVPSVEEVTPSVEEVTPYQITPVKESKLVDCGTQTEVDPIIQLIECLLKTKKDFSYKNGQLVMTINDPVKLLQTNEKGMTVI